MAFSWKRSTTATGSVAAALRTLEPQWTGAVSVTSEDNSARIFLFESQIYAVHLASYIPDVLSRLESGGQLSAGLVSTLRHQDPTREHVSALAVEQDMCSLESIAIVHGEFLAASLGAVMAADERMALDVESVVEEITSSLCVVPASISSWFDALDRRRSRMEADAQSLRQSTRGVDQGGAAVPWALGVSWVVSDVPSSQPPEFSALAGSLHGTTLDDAASRCGFTRAEAMHITAGLAAMGAIEATDTPAIRMPGCLVPEAWPDCP